MGAPDALRWFPVVKSIAYLARVCTLLLSRRPAAASLPEVKYSFVLRGSRAARPCRH